MDLDRVQPNDYFCLFDYYSWETNVMVEVYVSYYFLYCFTFILIQFGKLHLNINCVTPYSKYHIVKWIVIKLLRVLGAKPQQISLQLCAWVGIVRGYVTSVGI